MNKPFFTGYQPQFYFRKEDAALRKAIRSYVAICRANGNPPDAFAFSTFHQREYGNVPGRIIDEMITKELAEYGGGRA